MLILLQFYHCDINLIMATSKPTLGPHQFADEGTINVWAPMPFVCPCSYLVLVLAYLYRPLYYLLHRVRIKRRMFGSHLSWVTILRLPSNKCFVPTFVSIVIVVAVIVAISVVIAVDAFC